MNRILVHIVLVFLVGLSGCATEEDRLASHMEKARESIEKNDFAAAIIELKNVVQLDPKNDNAYYMLGEVYAARKEFQAAADAYGDAINANPENYAAHYKMGHIFLAAGRPMEARKAAKFLIEKAPENTDAYQLLAAVQVQENNLKAAVETLEKAVEIDRQAVMPRLFLAHLLTVGKEVNRAENVYLETISIHPDNPLPHIELAGFYAHQGRWDNVRGILEMTGRIPARDFEKASRLAGWLSKNGKWDLAEIVWKKSVDGAVGKEIAPLLALGRHYAMRREYDRAMSLLEEALAKEKDNPDLLLTMARIQMDRGNLNAAEAAVDRALVLHGDNTDANGLKGEILYSKKAYTQAITKLDVAITNAPDNFRPYYYKALAIMQRGVVRQVETDLFRAAAGYNEDTDAWVRKLAVDNLKKALDLNPGLLKAKIVLADIYLRKGNVEDAEKLIRDVLERAPNYPQAVSLLGSLRIMKGDLKGAEAICKKVLAADPNLSYWHARLGMVYRMMDRPKEALASLDRALQLDPLQFNALKLAVGIHLHDNNFQAALDACERQKKAVGENRRMLGAIENLEGSVWLAKKDHASAGRHFKAALSAVPDFISPRMGLAHIHDMEHREQEAIEMYLEILEINPDYLPACMALGRLYYGRDELKNAERYYRKALAIKPDHGPAANNLAWLLSKTDDKIREALDLVRLARKKMPRDASVRDTLGWIYYRTGQYVKAAEELEASLKVNPEYPLANYHLGLTYYRQEKFEAARALLKKALTLDPNFEGAEDARSLVD